MTDNLPTTTRQTAVGFSTADSFELMQRVAKAFTESDLVPEAFKGKIGNCIIGVELAQRIGASPLMVMQNLNVIHGRPAFSSKFIISAINTCGKFSPLRFKMEQLGPKKVEYSYSVYDKQTREKTRKTSSAEINNIRCTAYATELATGEVLEGPDVTVEMAVLEGWYTKTDSKWKTMPDLMLRYRAASFFGNLYAPEILMGMQTVEEVQDIIDVTPVPVSTPAPVATDTLNTAIADAAAKKRTRKTAPVTSINSDVIDAESATKTDVSPADDNFVTAHDDDHVGDVITDEQESDDGPW